MLPANLISTLQALALNDKPLITATPDKNAANAAKQFEPGQRVQGTVQTQVTPGIFNVRVANQVMQMQLPAFIRSGDIISLQVVSLQPRLTFSLAASSNPVSTPESLSATARLLSSLSQQPLERSYVRPIQSSPLWTGAQALPDTTQLAGKLHDALSHSGLFYESHQAQWIAGTRPTTQLLLEPQNQLTGKLLPQNPAAQAPPSQNASARNPETPVNPAPLVQGGSEQRAAAPTIPQHLQALVQQQLGALETHQVLWQGQVWQGQEMRWEVSEESPHRNAQGTEEGEWITQVNLDLPNLGGVSARLSFNGNALNLSFEVADAQTRDKLGNASSQLVAALSERGIPVTHTQITQNEHAG
ncbi:MAG: flagellar hook-length control protein FliK [Gammaproteobacteria bacterium]|nr:flagellar hook-length control protein FliK [Gammaproteobacteria bacterium]MBU1480852.1 flagellar hook-length control protein FliK [Gammaproteobacteria bacterium]